MPSATRTADACHKAAAEQYRRIPMPDMASAERLSAKCREHLDTLPAERRAQLEREW